ncbi:MAG: DNA internalization-related competence protein ComEC/Rec2 [Candidatus Binatia bacterium]
MTSGAAHPARNTGRRTGSAPVVRLGRALCGTPVLVWAALGLLAGDGTGWQLEVLPGLLTFAGASVFGLLLLVSGAAWRRVAVAGLAWTCGTVASHRVYYPAFPPAHVARAPMRVAVELEGVLLADPEPRGEHARLRLSAVRIDTGRGWQRTQGRVLLSVWHAARVWREGDRIRAHVSLRRPRNFGNPGEFDYVGYLARRGVYVTAFASRDTGFRRVSHESGGVTSWLRRWRHGVGGLIHRTLPEPEAVVLSALIIGTKRAVPADLRAAFSRAGVSHVLSISGLHVGLVAAAGYALFRWLLARSRWLLLAANVPKLAAALSILPVLLYAGIAGSNVATIRAVMMLLVFVAAVLVNRQRHLLTSLAAASIVVLLASPGTSLGVSFQLSFVAVLGLILGLERFWPWWRRWEEARLVRLRGGHARWWRPVVLSAVGSVSALAATTPLTAWHFNRVSVAALCANMVVVPVLGSIAVTLGLLAALAYTVSEALAWLCIVVAGPFVQLGLWFVHAFAALPYAAFRVVTPTKIELALVYAAVLAAVRLCGRARAVSLGLLAVLALGDGAWWYAERYERADMRLTFLSVGQGDSTVVEFPGAAVMVIDGGGLGGGTFDVGERIIAPFLWSRKIGHVDYLVLSHPQWDHYGGLAFLADHFSPREFWSNGVAAVSGRFAHLERVLRQGAVQRVVLHQGDQRRIGAVQVRVQSPPEHAGGFSVNDQSLVLSLALRGTRVLFTGDIEGKMENRLVARADGTLASAILKVPHHGSHTSSTARFVDAVAPRFAIISTGFDNRFGFPHADVLRRYAAQHARLARTDLDGAVRVRLSASGKVTMQRFRARAGAKRR